VVAVRYRRADATGQHGRHVACAVQRLSAGTQRAPRQLSDPAGAFGVRPRRVLMNSLRHLHPLACAVLTAVAPRPLLHGRQHDVGDATLARADTTDLGGVAARVHLNHTRARDDGRAVMRQAA